MLLMKGFFMKKEVKVIFHIDLNAFFASCAIIKEPRLLDKPFVVGRGNNSNRGIVTTASYPARKYGIRSGMSIADAKRLCRELLVVPGEYNLYKKHSDIFFNFLKKYSNILIAGSIDEAYIDMTEISRTRNVLEVAKDIQDTLYSEYQLPVSIGISSTLFLAKMASDMKKPLGITVLRKKELTKTLFLLPIADMYGIGKKTYPKLENIGIKTIGDFTKSTNKDKILTIMSESSYQSYIECVMGRSNDKIDPILHSMPKSISTETTFPYARTGIEVIEPEIKLLTQEIYEKLKKEEMKARTFGIRLKDTNFIITNRSKTVITYTDDFEEIYDIIFEILENCLKDKEVRLIGVFFKELIMIKDLKEDYNLFTYQELTKREKNLFNKK